MSATSIDTRSLLERDPDGVRTDLGGVCGCGDLVASNPDGRRTDDGRRRDTCRCFRSRARSRPRR